MTYKIGSIGEFAAWTKEVVRDQRRAGDVARKWYDSEATASRAKLSQRVSDLSDPSQRGRLFRRLLSSAERNAKKKGLPFDLTPDFIESLWKDGRCAVTGRCFTLHRFENAFVKHPFAPSIDRKSSAEGYTKGNVRLVCTAVNFGLGQWGDEVFLELAHAAVKLERQAPEPGSDADWESSYRERVAAAEALLIGLPKGERSKQRKRIAGLKSALAKGPDGLRAAAIKAARARKRNRQIAAQ